MLGDISKMENIYIACGYTDLQLAFPPIKDTSPYLRPCRVRTAAFPEGTRRFSCTETNPLAGAGKIKFRPMLALPSARLYNKHTIVCHEGDEICMSGQKKQAVLKQFYFRNFTIMVVIPLLVVFIGAFSAVNYLIRQTAVETIDAFQDSVLSALENDIRTASLQLSHFVYVNDGEFPAIAAQVHQAVSVDQYFTSSQQLDQAFHTAVVPSQDILSGMFYMKDGSIVYMADKIILPIRQVQDAGWYVRARQTPNQVQIGCYDTNRVRLTHTGQKRNVLILVAAMALDASSDKSGQIDLLAFFTSTQAGDVIRRARGRAELGTTVLLDEAGQVLYGDFGSETLREYFAAQAGAFSAGSQTRRAPLRENGGSARFLFRSRPIPDTGWTVVTFIQEAQLTQGFRQVGSLLVAVVALLLGLFYLFSRRFLNAIVSPIQTVAQGMRQLVNNDLDIQVQPSGHQEIRDLMESFNQMVLSLKNMLAINEEAHRRKHAAEMQALQSQINPHFIVNTLNSIRFMAQVSGYDGIRKMAAALISIVSCSFRSNVSPYTVREELEVLDSYVYLMQIRYSDSFEVHYQVQPDCGGYLLPRLILQPLVENAITHGLTGMEEEMGQVWVSVYCQGGSLCLEVRDNGQGMTPQQIQQILRGKLRAKDDNTSIGLENVLGRIRLHYGPQARMEVESQPGVLTCVRLRLPLDRCQKEEKHDPNPDR